MKSRRAWVVAASAAVILASGLGPAPLGPVAAIPPAPVILNSGAQNSGNAQWMETQAQPDDGGSSVKQFVATFLVRHAVGRTITSVRLDANFDGTDNTATAGSVGVTAQTYVAGGIETSRVTVSAPIGKPTGFSCPFLGGATRTVEAPVRMRVVDNTGEQSATVSTTVMFVEDGQCNARQDFPRMTSVSQSLTEVVPGQSIAYTFACSDPDTDALSSDDDCDRANIRWRRLDDGATSSPTLKSGINDDISTSHLMSFPSQGFYVVEAQLGNENGSFPNVSGATVGWWRLGSAVVNDPASSLSGSLAFSGVRPSSPPSVNPDDVVSAVATAADSGGSIQVIEWDGDGNGAFERREYSTPVVIGGDVVHPALTSAELAQTVNTATPGLRTVTARVTDNGALDAADNVRRQLTFSGQLRVNAVPTARALSLSSNEDTPLAVTMAGNDPDNQPAPLVYTIVSGPLPSAGTLGPVLGNQVVFTPTPGFSGPASFTYRVEDGTSSTVGAHAPSNVATVSITVIPVNDAPTVDPKSATTSEDTPVNIQATGTDPEGALTWSVASQPTNGSATCTPTAGLCTYSPALNFFGSDSFVVRGTDPGGASATATFSVTVTPVNDPPVAADLVVSTDEDQPLPITLSATDVDGDLLTFAPGVPSSGVLTGTPPDLVYAPPAEYAGPAAFAFSVSDGQGGSDDGTVGITVVAVNDPPVAVDSAIETPVNTAVTFALAAVDVDGDPLTFSLLAEPGTGLECDLTEPECTYTPAAAFVGEFTLDYSVADGRGGSDTGRVTITVRDVAPPTVVIRSPADGSHVMLGSPLTADYECADDVSLASCLGDVPDGAPVGTTTPGPATFTVQASDSAGNDTTVVAHYTVGYLFEGFGSPVDNDGVANIVNAGSRIPLKWRLSGATGGVGDAASIASLMSRQVSCESATVGDVLEETVSTPSGLIYKYDGNWQYTWVTLRSWSGTCREFVLGLADGTSHAALFTFR